MGGAKGGWGMGGKGWGGLVLWKVSRDAIFCTFVKNEISIRNHIEVYQII